MKVISFDIDGTVPFGDPPGVVSLERVREEKRLGHIIGSASDRTVSNQVELWQENGIELDFVVLKHKLAEVRDKFVADEYWHVGDTDLDQFFAKRAGFRFFFPDAYMEKDGLEGDPLP